MRKIAAGVLACLWVSVFALDAALPAAAYPSEDDAEVKRQVRKGKRVFRLHCQLCHGEDGEHPDELFSLADDKWRHGDTLEDIEQNVAQGVMGTAMLPFQGRLSEEDIKNVSRYVFSFIEESKDE